MRPHSPPSQGDPPMRPLCAPWLLRFEPGVLDVRCLVRVEEEAADADLSALGALVRVSGRSVTRVPPAGLQTTPLGPEVRLMRVRLPGYAGSGLDYALQCGPHRSRWIRVPPDPPPGEAWRFVVASDHQCQPGARASLPAIARLARQRTLHGWLFAGDLVALPDDPASWFGAADGLSFLDNTAAPADRVFAPEARDRDPEETDRIVGPTLLSSLPLLTCAGNHEVSGGQPPGASPAERFARVAPDRWEIATFARLMLPEGSDPGPGDPAFAPAAGADRGPQEPALGTAPPGCYTAHFGPLRLIGLLVARRWVPGDHERRTGPCYEPPGRFIFEPITPGSRQLRWLEAQTGPHGDGSAPRTVAPEREPAIHVVLMHHPPYAQGFNTVPPFSEPIDYNGHQIDRHLVPLLRPWADLVLSGHNHAVNHHEVDGVHFFESSHLATGKTAYRRAADGRPATEPLGHPSSFFAGESDATYFSILEVRSGPAGWRAEMEVHRVLTGGWTEVAYHFIL